MSHASGPEERRAAPPLYREQVLTVEPHGIAPISPAERHGHPRALATLWFAANMGLPVWLVGALALGLGLGFPTALAAILLGNLIGCALLALTASMGPAIGLPQLPFTRHSFGRRGVYLPAVLNWLSSCGWYAVNSVVGTLALVRLTTLPAGLALLLLTVGQVGLGVYGYNLIHRFEALSAGLLAALFLLMTAIGLPQARLGLPARLAGADLLGAFVLMTTAVAAYVFSWAPYAADYARYLPAATPKRQVFAAVFGGAFVSCVWLQLLGAAVATVGRSAAPIDLVVQVMGRFWIPALVAVVVGTLAANTLNIYAGALSVLTLEVPLPRWGAVLAVGVLGGGLAAYGLSGLAAKYENFLLLVSYWIGPWLAIVVVDFFTQPEAGVSAVRRDPAIRWAGVTAFVVGLACSVPFMSSALYVGPLARRLHGADLAYYVGMGVAGAVYAALRRVGAGRAAPGAKGCRW